MFAVAAKGAAPLIGVIVGAGAPAVAVPDAARIIEVASAPEMVVV